MFLQLWNVRWVTSFRLKQRRGFLGIREMRKEAPALEEKLDENKKLVGKMMSSSGKKNIRIQKKELHGSGKVKLKL